MTGRVRADRCSLGSTSRVIHMVIICDRIEYIASHVRRAGCRTEFEYTVFFCIRRIFMAEKRVITLRLEPELRRRIDGLAKAQRRSRSFIAAEAIRQYIAVNEWQIEEMVFTGTPVRTEWNFCASSTPPGSGRQICESRYSRSVHRLAAFFYRR